VNRQRIEQHGFKLVEQLDESSRTVIWKAIQNTLDRSVIIRVLKPEAAANRAEVDHFLTIARRFARIKSDSLAAVFDIVSEDDLHYVVMEHVEGPTLADLVAQQGPLPLGQVLRVAVSLVTSLEQMWGTARIVHRNLKSASIRLDPRGVAKITDFGLAIVAGPGVDATAMDDGHIVGTPCFLSPEQAQGTHMLNTQSDMYALGAVLYHLSTGKVPFDENEIFAILAAHVKQQMPPPHRLNPAIPEAFSWFVHRLMMKNPNNRYADWDGVLLDIRNMLAGTPPSCVRPDEEYLSTIDMHFTGDLAAPDSAAQDMDDGGSAPRVRLNRKTKKSTLAAYQSTPPVAGHAHAGQPHVPVLHLLCWALLAAWLSLVFWFRAVYQAVPNRPDPFALLGEMTAPIAESDEDLRPPLEKEDTPPPQLPEPKPLPAPVVSEPPPEAAKPRPENATAWPAKLMPDTLRQSLAQAFANADLATARQLASTSPDPFQEKEALLALLDQIPDPDRLVADFLKTQIGKPLNFERNGKQRTVIVRGVENGAVQVEANGRGAEFMIDKLSADEKLNWMEQPRGTAQSVAYCLTLMRSSRRAEIYAKAAGCPLLAPVLIEAAGRVPAATPPAE
jgi:serine/threonine protein kinase